MDAEGRWRPLGLYESLRAAQRVMGAEKRRPAIARAVEQVVRADQHDPGMAEIAVRTLDLDRLAAELEARVEYGAWADRLAPAITAPVPPTPSGDGRDEPVTTSDASVVDTSRPRVSSPRRGSTAERVAWVLTRKPDARAVEVAARLGVSERTVQRNWPTPNGRSG